VPESNLFFFVFGEGERGKRREGREGEGEGREGDE
jgi:hypothetical protein